MNKELMSYLKGTAINSYSFSRVFPSGKRIEIWSDDRALEESMLIKRHISDIYTPNIYEGEFQTKPFYLPSHLSHLPKAYQDKYSAQLQIMREEYGYSRPLNLVKKHRGHVDYHIFYLPTKECSAVNFYLSNLEKLDKIAIQGTLYANLQIAIGNYRIVEPLCSLTIEPNMISSLSKTESCLLNDLSEGKQYKNNTAGLSEDSAKVYIHRIKKKLGIKSKNELIGHYIRSLIA